MRHDDDLIDTLRAGRPLQGVLAPGEIVRLRREIAIREAVEAARDYEEIRRRLRGLGY